MNRGLRKQIRVRNYNRNVSPTNPTDWDEPRFGWIFVLFMLTWVSCQLWHNIVYYWLGALTNNPRTLTHYVGVFRGVLGAGEAVCFGLDSIKIPFIAESGGILLFYTIGVASFYYLGIYHIKDTNYDKDEEGAVVPNHILEEKGIANVEVHEGEGIQHIKERASVERSGTTSKVPDEKIGTDV